MIKFLRKIHLWLSVPFGLIITLICFSRAMLIFEPEITQAVKSNVYYVSSVKDQPLPMDELMERVKVTLPDSVTITGVTVFSDKTRTYQVSLSQPRRASVFIDQYTGVVTGKYERISFFSTMFKLHRWLLDSANPHGEGMKVGKWLVGISTIIFVIALLSGVGIWWPRARRKFKKSISISFNKGWRGFWKGLHVAGGMYGFLLVLAMALTGLTWSFDGYRTAFYAICGVKYTPRNNSHSVSNGRENSRSEGKGRGAHRNGEGDSHEESLGSSEFGCWQKVYDELKAKNPDAPRITINQATASVAIGRIGNGRAADKYEFNRMSGNIKLSTRYADANEADKLRGWIYAIHTGSLGGIITKILWLLAALIGASLPLTGYYIWIKHLLKRKKPSLKQK